MSAPIIPVSTPESTSVLGTPNVDPRVAANTPGGIRLLAELAAQEPQPNAAPGQILANAHRLRTEFGWTKDRADQYVQEQTGYPTTEDLVAAMANSGPAQNAPGLDATNPLLTAATGFGRGAAFGFADRLAGLLSGGALAASGLASGNPAAVAGAPAAYQQARDQARATYAEQDAVHPIVSGASQFAGGLASSLLPVLPAAKATTGLLGLAGKGALAGAGFSALGELGSEPDLTRPSAYGHAALAAIPGAVLGAGLGTVGGMLARRLSGFSVPAAEDAIKASGGYDALRAAEAKLIAAGRGPAAGGVPADLSPTMAALANSAASAASPEVRAGAQSALSGRNFGQPERLAQDLEDLYGKQLHGAGQLQRLQGIVSAIENDPETGYAALDKAVGPITDPRVLQFLQRPGMGALYQDVVDKLGLAGRAQPNGGVSFTALNALRRRLSDAASGAFDRGGAGGFTGDQFRSAARDLRQILEDNVPAFKDLQGRVAAAKDQLEGAVQGAPPGLVKEVLGANPGVATPFGDAFSLSQAQLEQRVRGLGPEQLDQFREALAANLHDRLADMSQNRNAAAQIMNSPAFVDKLRVVFGGQDKLDQYMARVEAERALHRTGAIFGNSETAQRMQNAAQWQGGGNMHPGISLTPHGLDFYSFGRLPKIPSSRTANPLVEWLLQPHTVDELQNLIGNARARGARIRGIPMALPGAAATPLFSLFGAQAQP